jgi:membrane associated rhomboid family serine protease
MFQESRQERKRLMLGDDGNALMGLLAVNAIVFVILFFIQIVHFVSKTPPEFYAKNVAAWFSLPASGAKLVTRPWTIFTNMFTHFEPLQFIGNMLWLWAFGYILQDMAGNRKLAPIYIYGGLVGSIVFLLASNLVPVLQENAALSSMYGASSAIMAVAVATTTLAPDYRFFPMLNGGIPIWVITLIYLIFDFALLASAGAGVGAAHLAGAGMGFLYVKQLQAGNDWGEWMQKFYYWLFNLFNPNKPKKAEQELYYKSNKDPFTKTPNVTQQRVDLILDKINQHGYHFLTDEEKEILKKASKDL